VRTVFPRALAVITCPHATIMDGGCDNKEDCHFTPALPERAYPLKLGSRPLECLYNF